MILKKCKKKKKTDKIKTLKKLSIEGNSFGLIAGFYEKHTTNIIDNGKN